MIEAFENTGILSDEDRLHHKAGGQYKQCMTHPQTTFGKQSSAFLAWSSLALCPETKHKVKSYASKGEWQEKLSQALTNFVKVTKPRLLELARLEAHEREIMLLKDRCVNLERTAPVILPVQSLAPEPYEIIKPFHVVVRAEDDEYVASFYDANLAASGESREEAFANLKDTIVATYVILESYEKNQLGPGPTHQLEVLRAFIGKRS